MPTEDLIRFVTQERHPPYGHRSGIFVAAFALQDRDELAAPEAAALCTFLGWFDENLAVPARFAASRYPRAQNTAISWIRASAHDCLTRLRELVAILDQAGIAVDELRTTRPGYILYEDAHQVVALPFPDTPR